MSEETPKLEQPPILAKEELIESQDSYAARDINKVLTQIISLNGGNVYHEPTCAICSNPYREEMENKWAQLGKTDSKQAFKEIQDLAKERSNLKLSKAVIENHMAFHKERSDIKELKAIEYVSKINRLNNQNATTLDTIKLCESALYERLVGINSISPNQDLSQTEVEKIKTDGTTKIVSSLNSILKLQAGILGEMKSSGEIITIPRKDFINIFNEAIVEAETPEQKAIVKSIMLKFSNLSKATQ